MCWRLHSWSCDLPVDDRVSDIACRGESQHLCLEYCQADLNREREWSISISVDLTKWEPKSPAPIMPGLSWLPLNNTV